jgi:hypothetical protein
MLKAGQDFIERFIIDLLVKNKSDTALAQPGAKRIPGPADSTKG